MDRLEAMEYFITAVEAGSFSAAGRQLNVPLPTVSRKVADLEAHLNTQLLVRSTRKLALTEVGVSYLAACKRILDQVDEAESQAAGVTKAGEIRSVVCGSSAYFSADGTPKTLDDLAKHSVSPTQRSPLGWPGFSTLKTASRAEESVLCAD